MSVLENVAGRGTFGDKLNRPPSGLASRAIMRSNVDLPQPEGPRIARNSPSAISTLKPEITVLPSKTRRTPSRRSATPPESTGRLTRYFNSVMIALCLPEISSSLCVRL